MVDDGKYAYWLGVTDCFENNDPSCPLHTVTSQALDECVEICVSGLKFPSVPYLRERYSHESCMEVCVMVIVCRYLVLHICQELIPSSR